MVASANLAGLRVRLRRWSAFLLALVVPLLLVIDGYYQWQTPSLDFLAAADETSRVAEVIPGGKAETAGLRAGDVLLTIDGAPASQEIPLQLGQVLHVQIARGGEPIFLDIPVVPHLALNYPTAIIAAVVVLTFWASGVLLVLRKQPDVVAQTLFVLGQVAAVALLGPLTFPNFWNAPPLIATASIFCVNLIGPLLLLLALHFPAPLGSQRQRRWALAAACALAIPPAVGGLSRTATGVQFDVAFTALTIFLALAVFAYSYYRLAANEQRRRLRVAFLGTLIAIVPAVLFYLLPPIFGLPRLMPAWATALFLVLAPLSQFYAVVRHNLLGLDRLINRAVVYAILSTGILLLYLGLFVLLYRVMESDPWVEIIPVAALTFLVGWGFDWSRTRVQRAVDSLFYGGWYDYPLVVEKISAGLARCLTREMAADLLTRQAPALMQHQPGLLWVGAPGDECPPDESAGRMRFEMLLQGRVPACWLPGPRRDGEAFSPTDRRILTTLAGQAEIALNNSLLIETLRARLDEIVASRETLRLTQRQLLRSREEERARLARELHDGPIQTLVGLNMQLGLLMGVAPTRSSPAAGDAALPAALDEMRSEVRGLLSEMRQVCSDLRPPMLDTLGLGAALRALAEDWRAQHGVSLQLEIPADGELRCLPPETAVNLYRVAQEALSNVARHAQARHAALQLALGDGSLRLTVRDDGVGFHVPPTPQALSAAGHFGLAGMAERAALIGGNMTVASRVGAGAAITVICPAGETTAPAAERL